MHAPFFELEAAVKADVAADRFSEALEGIKDFVTRVMYGQSAPGNVVGARKLDALCELVGDACFERWFGPEQEFRRNSQATKKIAILCTGLYKYGGTSLLIGDLARAHPDYECTVIATNFLADMSAEDLELSRIGDSGATVSVCPAMSSEAKLRWVMETLLELAPSRIFLLNHHQDSVIVSAARPFVRRSKVVFYHHADYNLCLGVHLESAAHVDPHNVGFYNCRSQERITSNTYAPMTVDDLRQNRVGTQFLRNNALTTCSSGSYHKFRNFYLYPYVDLMTERLRIRNGHHVHVGGIPDGELSEIRRVLAEGGVDPERFVHIPWTGSLWKELIRQQVDLFIGSFPIGGARTTIEVMGAGVPILMPENYLSRFNSSRDIVYRYAFEWKYPADFSRIICELTAESLSEHSVMSRAHYVSEYSSDHADLQGRLDAICEGGPTSPAPELYAYNPDHLDKAIHFDHLDALTSNWAVQQAHAGDRPAGALRSPSPSPVPEFSAEDRELYLTLRENPESIGFNPDTYLKRNPDVAAAGVDPLVHFVEYGRHEGRDTSIFYSPQWHVEMNADHAEHPCNVLLKLARTRSEPDRMRVALFAFAWDNAPSPDVYISEVIRTLARLGLNVDVYIGGGFVGDGATGGMRPDLPASELARFVRSQGYDFAIGFNNALVMPETVDALSCTIVSVIVDSLHHLFDHTDEGLTRAFELPIHAAPIYTSFITDAESLPNRRAKVSFLPAATRIEHRQADAAAERLNISFVASMLGDHNLDTFMSRVGDEVPGGLKLVSRCLDSIAQCGEIGRDPETQEAARVLCDWSHWTYAWLELHLQEVVTNRERLAVAERLAPLGLTIYGNARWHRSLTMMPSVASCFRSGAELRGHADLCAVYDRSRISINLPQIHAGTGMQYRILDILASQSLLITKHVPGSDIERLFGLDSPIVTFSNFDDLHAKCAYYLANETERLARVKACNALVAHGFSFRERALQYLALSNPTAAERVGSSVGPGSVTLIWPERVIDWASRQGKATA